MRYALYVSKRTALRPETVGIVKEQLPIIPSDRTDDLHGLEYADTADLVLFMAGNQFMVMEMLLAEFQKQYPEVKKIFYETLLPPGLELKQILAGGATFCGKVLRLYPDIYTSVNLAAMQTLEKAGHIKREGYLLYLHNRLPVDQGTACG